MPDRKIEKEIARIAKIIVDKFADLMLPKKERLKELEFMIKQAIATYIEKRERRGI